MNNLSLGAMTRVWRIKRNDTSRLEVDLESRDADGVWGPAFTSSSGVTVVFSLRPKDSDTPVVNRRACSIVEASADRFRVRFAPLAGDTATAGEFVGEFEVSNTTFTPTLVETYPKQGAITVVIEEDIA